MGELPAMRVDVRISKRLRETLEEVSVLLKQAQRERDALVKILAGLERRVRRLEKKLEPIP